MINNVLRAVGTLALVPTLALAQQRPATPPATTPPATAPRPATAPAAARGPQRGGSWEFTIAPAFFTVDQALNGSLDARNIVDDNPSQFMYGGYLGITKNFSRNLGLQIGSGLGVGNGAMLANPNISLVWTSNLNNKFSFFIPVGFNMTRIGQDDIMSDTRATSNWGAHAGLGIRSFLSGNVALRLEGRMAYEDWEETQDAAFNGMGLLGLSFFMGGGPPPDADMDGVPDKKDRCANTPRGAMVDANGCPRDADRDGVPDGLDRCANTPANTPVDANGCPRDSDGDGVSDNLDRCPNTPAGTPVDANGCPRDADGDGVADNADRCPNTPRGTPVDANGCPRDADGDGVSDNLDRCPNTPAGTPVDANGCPLDADGDGVADNADRCPNTAAGTQVGPDGCPLARDDDRDGVPNDRDRCPATPAGRMVDANGCPLAELPAVGASLVIRNITFASGTSQQPIRDIAVSMQAILRQTPTARFEVGGHTDNRGAAATNRTLSQARAQAVVSALTAAGVPASALTAVGYGPDAPRAPNTTAAGRAQNRRVEVKRLQ
jgi:outer membrane protein OmpA-like peptidoglycan-associated protein